MLILSTLLVTILNGLPIVPGKFPNLIDLKTRLTVVEDSISPEEVPEPSPEIEENTVPPPRVISPRVDVSVDVNEDGVLDIDEIRYAAFVHHGLSASVVEDLFKQVIFMPSFTLDFKKRLGRLKVQTPGVPNSFYQRLKVHMMN